MTYCTGVRHRSGVPPKSVGFITNKHGIDFHFCADCLHAVSSKFPKYSVTMLSEQTLHPVCGAILCPWNGTAPAAIRYQVSNGNLVYFFCEECTNRLGIRTKHDAKFWTELSQPPAPPASGAKLAPECWLDKSSRSAEDCWSATLAAAAATNIKESK